MSSVSPEDQAPPEDDYPRQAARYEALRVEAALAEPRTSKERLKTHREDALEIAGCLIRHPAVENALKSYHRIILAMRVPNEPPDLPPTSRDLGYRICALLVSKVGRRDDIPTFLQDFLDAAAHAISRAWVIEPRLWLDPPDWRRPAVWIRTIAIEGRMTDEGEFAGKLRDRVYSSWALPDLLNGPPESYLKTVGKRFAIRMAEEASREASKLREAAYELVKGGEERSDPDPFFDEAEPPDETTGLRNAFKESLDELRGRNETAYAFVILQERCSRHFLEWIRTPGLSLRKAFAESVKPPILSDLTVDEGFQEAFRDFAPRARFDPMGEDTAAIQSLNHLRRVIHKRLMKSTLDRLRRKPPR